MLIWRSNIWLIQQVVQYMPVKGFYSFHDWFYSMWGWASTVTLKFFYVFQHSAYSFFLLLFALILGPSWSTVTFNIYHWLSNLVAIVHSRLHTFGSIRWKILCRQKSKKDLFKQVFFLYSKKERITCIFLIFNSKYFLIFVLITCVVKCWKFYLELLCLCVCYFTSVLISYDNLFF